MRRSTRKSSVGLEPEELRPAVGSFSTRFSLPSFVKRVERLTDNQRNAIERARFGSILRIPKLMLSKNLLIELMDRWNSEEHAFLFLRGSMKISPMDVALILGLSVVGEPVILKDEEPFSDLEKDYGAVKRKITIASLDNRLDSLGGDDGEDFVRTFLLYMFGILLFPNANGKVDSRYLSFLRSLDDTGHFAWGAAVLEDIFMWLDKRKQNNVQSLGGCLIFLQIWSYEHIDIGRPALVDSYMTFPRACRWGSSRPHQRQWFAERFNELQDDQITWELQPTLSELGIVVIKELLAEENKCEGSSCSAAVLSSSHSSINDIDSSETESILENVSETEGSRGQQMLLEQPFSSENVPEFQSETVIYPPTPTPELRNKLIEPSSYCQQTSVGSYQAEAQVETVKESHETKGHDVLLEPQISSPDSVANVPTEAAGYASTSSNPESEKEPLTLSSKCQQIFMDTDISGNVRRTSLWHLFVFKVHFLCWPRSWVNTTSNGHELMLLGFQEGDLLQRNQLLEKENMELRKEMENLRIENMQLRNLSHLTNNLVVRLEGIVMDETEQA